MGHYRVGSFSHDYPATRGVLGRSDDVEMSKRLYQRRFDQHFNSTTSQDVTPEGFVELTFPTRLLKAGRNRNIPSTQIGNLGRFVREATSNVQVTSPKVAADYLQQNIFTPFEQFDQEEMWVLLLNTKNRITHEAMVYRGTLNSAVVRIAEIFKEAIRVNANGLILSHCHPSGDPTPSPEDVIITSQAKEAADLLSIAFEDHIIVGKDTWVSLREHGLGFDPNPINLNSAQKLKHKRRINENKSGIPRDGNEAGGKTRCGFG